MLSEQSTARESAQEPVLHRRLRELGRAISGEVVTPQDANWDEARLAWALSVDQRPAAVALPENAADVSSIVTFARVHGLRVAGQGTGHNAHLLEGRLAETILIKTERMRAVQIDAENRRARVDAGAVWLDVVEPAAERGLAALAGSSPDVGVVGYTLGGGLSWLSRKHGLSANNVHAIELVTADGRRVRTDREHEPDLFWALRGGGGSFGIVTAIEIDLLPITQVYAGAMFFPLERAREVLQAWREWTAGELPEEIISVGRVINFPPFEEVPEPVRGRSFAVLEAIHIGGEDRGAELVAPLRELGPVMDTFGMVPMPALSHLHMDPEHPVPGKGDGMLLGELTAETVDALVDFSTSESGSALLSVEVRQLGGAIGRPAPEHGALAAIEAPYAMFAVGITPDPHVKAIVEGQVTGVKHALERWAAPSMYLNFAERPVEPERLYAQEYTYRRLQAIKAKYDPRDMIQANHPIRPAH